MMDRTNKFDLSDSLKDEQENDDGIVVKGRAFVAYPIVQAATLSRFALFGCRPMYD
jgi:hypothetical protein